MSEDIGALPQTGAPEPVPSDNVGGKQLPDAPVQSEKVSLRDSISQAYDEIAKAKEPPTAPAEGDEPPPAETEEQKAERLRDEQGRFAKSDKPADKIEGEPAPKPGKIDPPVHWRGEQKLKWANVPNEIKAAIAEDAKQRQEIEARAAEYDDVITPQRKQLLQVAYGDHKQGLNQILATVEFSNNDPNGFIRWFAQSRGINLGTFAPNQQEQPQTGLPPELQQYLEPVLNKVTTLEQTLRQSQQAAEQQFQASVAQEAQAFMADHQNFPFAQDVRAEMATLLTAAAQTGRPMSLKEAYDKAVWSHPDIRNRMLAEQRAQEQRKQQEQALQKKQLASSVTGAPGTATPIATAPAYENPRDTVRRTLSEMGRV